MSIKFKSILRNKLHPSLRIPRDQHHEITAPPEAQVRMSRGWQKCFENLRDVTPRPLPLYFTMFEYPHWLTLLGGERGWQISDNTQCQYRAVSDSS